MAKWKVQLQLLETFVQANRDIMEGRADSVFTAECRTLREAADMVFMVVAAYEPKDARAVSASMERAMRERNVPSVEVRNAARTHCVSIHRVNY